MDASDAYLVVMVPMSTVKRDVAKRAGIVGVSTMASRVLGLVRESVVVALFPKDLVDAFQTAFLIPNTFRRLTGEGAFSPAVVSVFTKIWEEGDLNASRRFVRAVFGFTLLFLLTLTVLGVVGAEPLTFAASWGSGGHEEKYRLATVLTRLMFPYVFFISLTALAMGLLNAAGRFFAPSFAPVLLNLSIIGCALGISGILPAYGVPSIYSLAVGVILGGVLQAVFQVPSLKSLRLLVLPSTEFRHTGLVKVLRLTGPMVIGAAAYQFGIIFNNSLAWTLPHGSVMYINSANRLIELPLAVLVMAISIAALPSLASLRGAGKTDEMLGAYRHALSLALAVATPAMVGLVVLAEPIVAILYQRGHFGYFETLQTAAGLRFAALGICSVALVRQTVPVFYAMENSRIPMVMTVVFVITNGVSGFVLKGPFLHVGLCMAISIAPTVQGVGLLVMLRRTIGPLGLRQVLMSWLRVLAAVTPMTLTVWGTARLGDWRMGSINTGNYGVLALAVVLGTGVYLACAVMFRVPEVLEILRALNRRWRRR